jgi:hypothetical protein
MTMSMAYDEMKRRAGGELKQKLAYRAGDNSWDWCSLGAAVGLGGGLIAVLVGSVLTAISWLTGTAFYMQAVGAVLLFLTIPLLVFGAQCLDLMEKKHQKRDLHYHEQKE